MYSARDKIANKIFKNFINTPQATIKETNILLKTSLGKGSFTFLNFKIPDKK